MLGVVHGGSALARNSGRPAQLSESGGWTAFCDNSGGCGVANVSTRREAFAARSDAEAPWACLWLGAADMREARLSIKIDPGTGNDAAARRPSIILQAAGGAAETDVGSPAVARLDRDGRYIIGPDRLPGLVAAWRQADVVLVREADAGPVLGRMPLDGLRSSLNYAQGGQTAARTLPRISPRPFGGGKPGDPRRTAALQRVHCADEPAAGKRVETFRLGRSLHLWTVDCRRYGYNALSLAMTGTHAGKLSPLVLKSIVDHDGVGPDLSNLAVHAGSGIIEDYHKTRGAGDCGKRRRWAWNGGRFVLISEEVMPRCFGANHSQWLRLHASHLVDDPQPARPPC